MPLSPILSVLVLLLVVGVVLRLIHELPIDATMQRLAMAVIIAFVSIGLILWVAGLFGVAPAFRFR